MAVASLLRLLWLTGKFFAATSLAFGISALFSFALAKRLRDDEYPGWEAFVYGLCCYALVFQVWWRWLLRWWLHASPRDSRLWLIFGACASFFFAAFLLELVLLAEPPKTTTRHKAVRVLFALTILAGTAVMTDVATIRSPLSQRLRAAVRLGRGRTSAAPPATEPTAAPR